MLEFGSQVPFDKEAELKLLPKNKQRPSKQLKNIILTSAAANIIRNAQAHLHVKPGSIFWQGSSSTQPRAFLYSEVATVTAELSVHFLNMKPYLVIPRHPSALLQLI